ALAARRQVHRDRGSLQPAVRAVADRARRDQGEGLDRQGRAALGCRRAAHQGQEHRLSPAAELVEYLARRLVEAPDAVSVEEVEEDGALVIRLRVAQEDLGRVIGRGGRIARALRTLARASGGQSGSRVLLEILE